MPGLKSKSLAVLLCCLVLLAAGCRKRGVQAAPPVVVVPPVERVSPPPETLTPETPPTTEPEPAKIDPAPARRSPARTAPPSPAPAPPRPATPQLSPRLSATEQAEYERNTQAAITAAERNMRAADGRRLNALQVDLLEKIRGFLAQSREAIRAADWIRALNLAEKARTLSVELVSSL